MKPIRILFVTSILLIIAGGAFYFTKQMYSQKEALHAQKAVAAYKKTDGRPAAANKIALDKKSSYPTVFIHGWDGSERSFSTMLDRLSHRYDGPERAMIVHVRKNGTLTVTGSLSGKRIPLIQIIFDNNQATMETQAKWLKTVFHDLKSKEGVDKMDVVSHSMGGKSFTYYLETIDNPTDYPVTNKYIAIAAPFDWVDGPQNEDAFTLAQLKQQSVLYQMRGRLPGRLKVLAIAGVINNDNEGDGQVPLRSAFFGRYIFAGHSYQEEIVRGKNARHSRLHENPEVDKLIARDLWGIK